MLVYALSRGCIIIFEYIYPLTGENCMVIRGGQCVCDALLTAETVAAVLRLAVDGVAGDADRFRQMQCEGQIVASSPIGCDNGRSNIQRPFIAGILPVVFE